MKMAPEYREYRNLNASKLVSIRGDNLIHIILI